MTVWCFKKMKNCNKKAATAEKAAMVTSHARAGGNVRFFNTENGGLMLKQRWIYHNKVGRRAHHMGDFLPKDKMDTFLAKCRSVVETEGQSTKEGAWPIGTDKKL